MSTHPSEHEQLLARALALGPGADDPELQAQLEACAACRLELERLRALDAELDQLVQRSRREVATARGEVASADTALVRRSLERAMAGARARRSRRTLLVALAAAAGLVLAIWLGMQAPQPVPGTTEILLSGGSIACRHPVGPVDDYDEFVWTGSLPPGGRYELQIRALENGRAGRTLETIACTQPSWTPSPQERRALPDAIHWTVVVLDVTDQLGEEGWARASRSSPSR